VDHARQFAELHAEAEALFSSLDERLALLRAKGLAPGMVPELQRTVNETRAALPGHPPA
jgi:hypothetical protein